MADPPLFKLLVIALPWIVGLPTFTNMPSGVLVDPKKVLFWIVGLPEFTVINVLNVSKKVEFDIVESAPRTIASHAVAFKFASTTILLIVIGVTSSFIADASAPGNILQPSINAPVFPQIECTT